MANNNGSMKQQLEEKMERMEKFNVCCFDAIKQSDSESDPKVASIEGSAIAQIAYIQVQNTAVRTLTGTTSSTSSSNGAATTSSTAATTTAIEVSAHLLACV